MIKNLQLLADDILHCGERYFDKAIKDKAVSVMKPAPNVLTVLCNLLNIRNIRQAFEQKIDTIILRLSCLAKETWDIVHNLCLS
jgi:hypothetical protein